MMKQVMLCIVFLGIFYQISHNYCLILGYLWQPTRAKWGFFDSEIMGEWLMLIKSSDWKVDLNCFFQNRKMKLIFNVECLN